MINTDNDRPPRLTVYRARGVCVCGVGGWGGESLEDGEGEGRGGEGRKMPPRVDVCMANVFLSFVTRGGRRVRDRKFDQVH